MEGTRQSDWQLCSIPFHERCESGTKSPVPVWLCEHCKTKVGGKQVRSGSDFSKAAARRVLALKDLIAAEEKVKEVMGKLFAGGEGCSSFPTLPSPSRPYAALD